ncbi:hypothetical protein ACFQZE_21875 [Paenibacillus sp. GCM10027627]|uniref:hypothetical protein n=1 Tax=unclassified Paenibacillus TaxID=185978 RepID=UPI003644BC17
MRETSNLLSKQNSQQPKQFRGGEKKVMKKSLSLLVAIAMVFSMFATVVSAAEQKTAGQILNELGVIKGNADGDLKEDQTWKRQDIIVLLSRLLGEEAAAKATAKSHKFTDVKDKNYDGYISWAVAKGLTTGKSATKFGFGDELKNQDFYTFVIRVFDKEVKYEDVPAKAKALKLADDKTDFNAIPKRGDTYTALVTALNTEVPGTGKTLAQVLGLIKVADGVSSAAAVGAKKVEVKFNGPVDTAKAVFALKRGNAVVNVKASFDAAKTVATLESTIALPAGDYTVTVSGLGLAAGKDAAKFTVAAERIETVSIEDNGYRTGVLAATNTVEVAYKLLNQYGEEVSNGVAGNIKATTSVGTVVEPTTGGKVVINLVPNTTTALNLTVVDLKFAKSASKAVTVQLAKHVGEVTLSAPEVEAGKTLEAGKTAIKLPYVAKDQYGNVVDLAAADLTGLTFIKSDEVTNIALTSDKKKLQFDIAAFSGPKKLAIQVIVNATGKSSKVEFDVNGGKSINAVTLVAPADQFGLGQANFKVEIQANDQYGNALTAQEIVDRQTELVITSGNTGVFNVGTIVRDGDKAYVQVTSPANGSKSTALLLVTIKTNSNNSSISLTVVDAKYAATVNVTSDVTKAVKDASITLKGTFTDQYGNAYNAGADAVVVLEVDNANFGAVVDSTYSITAVKDTGIVLTAADHDKATKVSFKLFDTAANATAYVNNNAVTAGLLDTATIDLASVKSDAALTYEIEALGTIAAKAAGLTSSAYAKEIKVVGKDSSGAKVALKSNVIQQATAADPSILTVNNSTGGTWKVAAVADKEGATKVNVFLAKQNGDVIVQTADLTISKAAPVVASITAKKTDDAVTKVTVAQGSVNVLTKNGTLWFEVKDQYGVVANATGTQGPTVAIFVTNKDGVVSVVPQGTDAVNFNAAGTWKVNVSSGSQSTVVEVTVQ